MFQNYLKSFIRLNKPMPHQKIVLKERTFARSKGCWNCVTGDSLVLTHRGAARLDSGQPQVVYNAHGFQPTDGWLESTGVRDVVEVITTHGARVKVTPDHRIFTERGWVAAADLQAGTEVAGIIDSVIGAKHVNPDTAFLIGAITGDGWTSPTRGVGFGFRADGHDWGRLVRIAQEHFESRGVPSLKNEGRFKQIEWRTNAAKHWAETFSKAHVPEDIWVADTTAIGAYLRGLFSTDGTVGREYPVVSFYQANEQFVREVQLLLRMIGITSQINVTLRAPKYRDLWSVTIGRRPSIMRFLEVIGFEDQARQRAAYAAGQAVKDYKRPERIHRVVPAGAELVYDISVPVGNSFYANGLLVHNCSKAGDPGVGMAFWKNHARPRDERILIRPHKEKLAAIPAQDQRQATKAKRSQLLKVIERNAGMLDATERAIAAGELIRCTSLTCKDPGDFKSHRFLCDQWCAATGASLAAGGGPTADMLPEEMKDVFGDGN